LLSGKPLSGADAKAKGLITESVSRDGLDNMVQHWVDMFLAQSPKAVQTTKQALNLDIVDKAKRYMDEMLRLETISWASPNHPEAVHAILEKRPPQFTNE
jgi:enoyl-CoA hydratase